MTVSRVPNVEGGIQPTIVTAKGDLITAVANANPARLGVGSDGQLLTADSTTATGLSYQNNFAAGKNKIINGDMRFNQRNFTSISGSADTYGFDRIKLASGGGATYTPQTFSPGSAPVAGYSATNYARVVTSGQSGTSVYSILTTNIEDVRILSGETATISFWARSASGTPKIALELTQIFGTGGSPSATVNTYVAQSTISTTWTRYSITTTIPSISGKTIGTTANTSYTAFNFWVSAGTDFNSRSGSLGIQSNTFDIWGIQVEQGSTATAFQTATGTIQGELAACQRYYWRMATGSGNPLGNGSAYSASHVQLIVQYPVTMRVAPALDMGTGTDYFTFVRNGGSDTFNSFTIDSPSTTAANLFNNTQISSTAGNGGVIFTNNASAYLGFTSEL